MNQPTAVVAKIEDDIIESLALLGWTDKVALLDALKLPK